MLAELHRLYRIYTGKSPAVTVTTKCPKVWYGNSYGGFYVCPEALPARPRVYSIGVGKDISFDEAMIRLHQAEVYAFDPTPDSIAWFEGIQPAPSMQFYPVGISAKTGVVDFYLPKNPQHVSGSLLATELIDEGRKIQVSMKRLSDICAELQHTHIDVLKMDIEGAEYDVIPDILQTPVSISQLVIEFHGRVLGHQKTIATVQMLKTHGYEVFAISKGGEEISFIK
jgi:FkbM family methyltransferase